MIPKVLTPEIREYLTIVDGQRLFADVVADLTGEFGLTPEAAGKAIGQFAWERA